MPPDSISRNISVMDTAGKEEQREVQKNMEANRQEAYHSRHPPEQQQQQQQQIEPDGGTLLLLHVPDSTERID